MSRLCRLKTASHGEDGKWAHGEILRLRAENAALRGALEGAAECVEEAIVRRIDAYGENFRPQQLQYLRELKAACDKALDGEKK